MALLHLHVAFRDFSNVLGTVFPPGLVFQSQSFLALPGLNSSNFIKVRGGLFWHNLAIHHSIQRGPVIPMWDGKARCTRRTFARPPVPSESGHCVLEGRHL